MEGQESKPQGNVPLAKSTARAVDSPSSKDDEHVLKDSAKATDSADAAADPNAIPDPAAALLPAGLQTNSLGNPPPGVNSNGTAVPWARGRSADGAAGAPAGTTAQVAAAVALGAPDGADGDLGDLSALSTDAGGDAGPSPKAGSKATADGSEPTPFASELNAANAKASEGGGRASLQGGEAPAGADAPPEARFAQVNHRRIVTGVHGELLPNGGSMHLRLDPPDLGDLLVTVHMRDGVMTAAFHTSNDEATRLLSHSLGELKSMLETQGVSVEKLHVQQGPKNANTGDARDPGDGARRDDAPEQRHSDRQEQQRKAMIQKMWDKLAGKDPVDLVA